MHQLATRDKASRERWELWRLPQIDGESARLKQKPTEAFATTVRWIILFRWRRKKLRQSVNKGGEELQEFVEKRKIAYKSNDK